MTESTGPAFRSLAFDDIPAPDYADSFLLPLPATTVFDPQRWAETIFSQQSMPGWFAAMLRLRRTLSRSSIRAEAIGKNLPIRRVEGAEALIGFDSAPLGIRCGVGLSSAPRLLRVTTAVRSNNPRGRRIFGFLRPIHPLVMNSMIRKAARILAE